MNKDERKILLEISKEIRDESRELVEKSKETRKASAEARRWRYAHRLGNEIKHWLNKPPTTENDNS